MSPTLIVFPFRPGRGPGDDMANDCIFCKVIKGEIRSDILDRDSQIIVLRDINPQAPTHLLIVPIQHIAGVIDIGESRKDLMSRLVLKANEMAARTGIAEKGYRLAINQGQAGAQSIAHLHLHLLGGRLLSGKLG